MKARRTIAALAAMLTCISMAAQSNTLVIEAGSKGIPIQKTMFGLFFEDLNFAADGGLYAEKIKNRSFEFDNPLAGWDVIGNDCVMADGPFANNPHYVRLGYPGHPSMITGICNEGFFGIGVEAGSEYRVSMWARNAGDRPQEQISIQLCQPSTMGDDQTFCQGVITVDSPQWKKYELVLKSPLTVAKAEFRAMLVREHKAHTPGQAVDVEHISLFPVETFNGDENGMRKDIAEAIQELHPGVFRFPGGCIVEGTNLETRYQWKNSVGPVENRPINKTRWSYTFPHRMFPDYYQSCGMGFYEYFRFAEEIGAEPLPVVSCGIACQFENEPHWHSDASLEDLQPFVDDALDLIEFANGPVDSKWGRVRAEMGHPEPFGMKYIGIGNEQWGEGYPQRLALFVKAIRAKYPEIAIIGSSGPYKDGADFEYLWKEMRALDVDLVDEHYYADEKFFTENAARYDSYPRTGPKVFAGEYACHGTDGRKWNHFNASLLEAAFMTGLERNADVVHMASYAPLLAHVEGWQWRPDMIWFDNLQTMRSCSYYVQQMYAANCGTHSLPVLMDGEIVAGQTGPGSDKLNGPDSAGFGEGLYASAVRDEARRQYIVKVVNLASEAQEITLQFKGLSRKETLDAPVTCTVLHSDDPYAENTIDAPDTVVPVVSTLDASLWHKNTLTTTIGPRSFAVYSVDY